MNNEEINQEFTFSEASPVNNEIILFGLHFYLNEVVISEL